MKTLTTVVCLTLALSACGGDRAKPKQTADLDGIQSFLKKAFTTSREGAGLCGDPTLQGEVVGSVPGKLAGCGVDNAIRLQVVDGIALSQGAVMDCTTAQALKTWVNASAKPATAKMGKLAGLRVAAHYSCRTRNNKPGAKISEHGRGKAIDISAFVMADGTEISVLDDWGRGKPGKALRQMHGAACGTFGTVLGPGSDGHHKDHFHFDTARHGNGAYCRPK